MWLYHEKCNVIIVKLTMEVIESFKLVLVDMYSVLGKFTIEPSLKFGLPID